MDKPLSFAWALPGVEAVFRVGLQVGSDEFSHCDGVQLGRNDVIETETRPHSHFHLSKTHNHAQKQKKNHIARNKQTSRLFQLLLTKGKKKTHERPKQKQKETQNTHGRSCEE